MRALVSAAFTAGVIVSVTFPLAEMAGYAVVYGGEQLLLLMRQLAAISLGEEALSDDFSVLAVIVIGGVAMNVALNVAFCGIFVTLLAAAPSLAAAPPDHG